MIHQPFDTLRSSSPNQFVPEIISPLPCSSELVRHTLVFVLFFQKVHFSKWHFDKCHTSVLNALIPWGLYSCRKDSRGEV